MIFSIRKMIFAALVLMGSLTEGSGQIDDVLQELEKDKKERSKNPSVSSGDSDDPDGFAAYFLIDFFRLLGGGVAYLQGQTLQSRKEHPGVVSLEAFIYGGYYSKHEAVLFSPQLRANWGIFSSEFRNQRVFDRSGMLDTYDWQVLKINVPVYPVNVSFGMGFTSVPQVGISYFEYSLSGSCRFLHEKAVAEVTYRSTDKKSSRWFRREIKATFDYELKQYRINKLGRIGICPMAGFVYQNYFALVDQYYLLGGVNFRLY